ncbi:nuclear transport factor 2 family protein [Flavobacterium sp.]|uniref:nuclear transport factor 2 family protein n=1 Tax=Flavobacterium sp. TaxID=239 RepID=UPI00375274E9
MKKILFLAFIFSSCSSIKNVDEQKTTINSLLNNWHKAAANANFNEYFNMLSPNAIYIGTDATENWTKPQFEAFAKPYFDKGKAWSFTALERNIYFSKDKKTAWFDELLNTQMKICRASGVLVLTDGSWKISHYVLSMTIPNDTTNEVIKIKSAIENPLIEKLQKK